MRYWALSTMWFIVAMLYWMTANGRVLRADPTDDFSFTLTHDVKSENYLLMSQKRIAEILADRLDLFPQSQTPKLAAHFRGLCQKYRFDPAFVLSLIQVESGFRVKVVSSMGASGLMQLMPATAQLVCKQNGIFYHGDQSLMDPFTNLAIGIAYLASLRDHYKQATPYRMVAAYNLGPARLDELMANPGFRPVSTKQYFEKIREGVPSFRFYRRSQEKPGV